MNHRREDLEGILRAALEAIEPGRLVERALGESVIPRGTPLWIIAAGKAAPGMAAGAIRTLDGQVRGGLLVGTSGADVRQLECRVAGHPVPTEDSEQAGLRALSIASGAAADECVLVLLSGGASALLSVPAPGVTLDDKRQTTQLLLNAGADIHALNTVRKHLSRIKGGWLAAASDAAFQTLAVSDVVDDDVSVIGSGPTVPDPTTFRDALGIMQRFGGPDAYPPAVVSHITNGARGTRAETPKPDDARIQRSRTSIIGGRRQAMQGAADEARRRGYRVTVFEDATIGEARQAGAAFAERELARNSDAGVPVCVIASGETIVRVTGSGRGGRNQEFALAAAGILAASRHPVTMASIGTDGIDGVTEAAGAVADDHTMARARRMGLGSPQRFLDNNDAYAFFAALGDLICTGPTGTNVGDLQVLLIG